VKLSDLDPKEVEVIGGPSSQPGDVPKPRNPSGLRLSDLNPGEIEKVEYHDPSTSPVTAATTGIIQGAVPFAGALAGLGKVGMDAITGVRGPLAGGSLDDLLKDYRSARDSFTGDAKSAAEAHPDVSIAGNIAGGMANPLFQGAGHSLGKLMGAGAVQGLGMSDADLTQGQAKDALADTALGAAGGALGYGVGNLLPKVFGGAKSLGKKALTNLGPSAEAIDARFAKKAQDTAMSHPELAEDMGKSLKELSNQIAAHDEAAWNTLSDEKVIPKAYIEKALDDALAKLRIKGQTFGAAGKKAETALFGLKDDLNRVAGSVEKVGPMEDPKSYFQSSIQTKEPNTNLSEKELKGLIQRLDENIDWGDQENKTLNTLLEGVRNGFDDTLKTNNSAYRKAMVPVAERTGVLNELKRLFNFRNVPGEGLQPTDSTASKIQSAPNENRAVTQDYLQGKKDDDGNIVNGLKQFTGKDYLDLANDYKLSKEFQVQSPKASSKKVNIGAAGGAGLGALMGGPTGAAIGGTFGASLGGMADAFGGRAAAKIIDTLVKAGDSKAFGKFAPVIEKAAARGPEALAVVGAVLSDNPEFQQILGEQTVRVRNRSGRMRRIPKYRLPAALQDDEQVVEE
jgi:hypothetical protein